jgi:DNA-binding NarL/FixJ family response regulator
VAENNTLHPLDAVGVYSFYYVYMIRVFTADALPHERAALRLLLFVLNLEMVGEAANWLDTLDNAPRVQTELLLVDFDLLPQPAVLALDEFRKLCPAVQVVILAWCLDGREHALLADGANVVINKSESSEELSNFFQRYSQSRDN